MAGPSADMLEQPVLQSSAILPTRVVADARRDYDRRAVAHTCKAIAKLLECRLAVWDRVLVPEPQIKRRMSQIRQQPQLRRSRSRMTRHYGGGGPQVRSTLNNRPYIIP